MKKVIGVLLFLAFSLFIYRTSVFRISKNFYTVQPDRFYRSAQLSTEELEEVVKQYHIKTVVSLRGSPGKTDYYEPEAETLEKLKVNFEFLGMSDDFYPHQDEIRKLVSIFQKEDAYPILIHCRVGADRTGMVSGLFKKLFMKASLEEALEQVSFRFWHVTFLHPAMSEFVKKVKDINWLANQYDSCLPEFSDYRRPSDVCK